MRDKMNSQQLIVISVVIVLGLTVLVFSNPAFTGFITGAATPPAPIQAGWMISWAEPALVIETLKHTDILTQNDVLAEMISFSYGPPIVEAALADKVNVTFLGSVPSFNLLNKSSNWVVVGRHVHFTHYLIVRSDSGIQDVADLKGKKIGVPYATGPHTFVLEEIRQAGLDPKKDVELINIKPADLPLALETGQVGAVSWEAELLATLQERKTGYPIASGRDIGLILVSKKLIEKDPAAVRNFLRSVKEASFFVAQNKEQTFEWFSNDSSLPIQFLSSLQFTEPNYSRQHFSEVEIGLTPQDISYLQQKIDFEAQEGIITKTFDLESFVDLSYSK